MKPFSSGNPQRLSLARAYAFVALSACAGTACAAAAAGVDYTFNGFATFGLAHSSEREADFATSFRQPTGAGHTRNWSPTPDSRIGGQVTAQFDSNWSAVVQVISEQNWDKSFTPHVEWANIKYAFTPDFSVRVGRITMPTYFFSESRKVGYSMPSVRSATYFYTMLPVSTNDGIDATYRFRVGDITNTTSVMYGRNKFTVPDGTQSGIRVQTSRALAMTNRTEYGNLTLQLSHFGNDCNFPKIIAIPDPALSRLGDDQWYTFNQAAFSYDPGQWYVLGEIGKAKASFLGHSRGWYLSGGYRIGKVTPYLIYESQRQLTPSPGFFPNPELDTPSIGARWDVYKNVDIKVQYDHNKLGPRGVGPLVNLQPKFVPGRSFSVVSLVADVVF